MAHQTSRPKYLFHTLPHREDWAAQPSQILLITDAAILHHLKTVTRSQVGEQMVIVDPEQEWGVHAEITQLEKREIQLTLLDPIPSPSPSPPVLPSVTIAVGLVKEQRWNGLLQKGTELGVRTFVPVQAHRSVVHIKNTEAKLHRWQTIVREAAEQSEGLFIPTLTPPMSVHDLCQSHSKASTGIVLTERADTIDTFNTSSKNPDIQRIPLNQYLEPLISKASPIPSPLTMAIGPEGGWTPEEIQTFLEHGFHPASLGQRILRTETAVMAAMSALVYAYE